MSDPHTVTGSVMADFVENITDLVQAFDQFSSGHGRDDATLRLAQQLCGRSVRWLAVHLAVAVSELYDPSEWVFPDVQRLVADATADWRCADSPAPPTGDQPQ